MGIRKLRREMARGAHQRDAALPLRIAKAARQKIAEHDLCNCGEFDRRRVPDEVARLADTQDPQACGLCGKTKLVVYAIENPPTIKLAWPAAQQTAEGEKHGA